MYIYMRAVRIAIIGVLLLTLAGTILSYPYVPDPIVSHWNAAGEADGTMPRLWGLFLLPFLMFGLTAFFAVIPRIEPLRENYARFHDYYEGFILVFAGFMAVVQLQIILWNLGIAINPNRVIPLPISILFAYLSYLIEHAEQNWFVGIRTPWTLSSEAVWKKTHRLGARLFRAAALLALGGLLFPDLAIWFILVPVGTVALSTVVYSYREFQRLGGKRGTGGEG